LPYLRKRWSVPRVRAARIRAKGLPAVALGFLVALAACTVEIGPPSVPRPDVVYKPDVAGPVSDGTCDHVTDTCTLTVYGETLEIGPNARSLDGGDAPGGSNTVLLYGAEDDASWFLNVRIPSTGKRAGCAALNNSDAWDAGDAIVFAFTGDSQEDPVVGVQLPKSDGWDEDIDLEPDGRFPAYYNWWCLDLHGRVSAVYPGTGA
jgi:hypothetical protein